MPLSANDVRAKMQNWYLSLLRQQVLTRSGQRDFTPLTQIKLDSSALQELVVASNASSTEAPLAIPLREPALSLKFAAALIAILSLYAIFAATKPDGINILFNSTIGALTGVQTKSASIITVCFFGLLQFALLLTPDRFLFARVAKPAATPNHRVREIATERMVIGACLLILVIQLNAVSKLAVSPEASLLLTSCTWLSLLAAAGTFLYRQRSLSFQQRSQFIVEQSRTIPDPPEATPTQFKDELDGIFHALKSAQIKEQCMVDYAPYLVFVIDANGKFIAANLTTTTLLGFLPEELVDRSILEYCTPEDAMQLGRLLNELSTTERAPARDCEVQCLTKRGALIDLRLSLHGSHSEKLIFGTGEDISGEKELERTRADFISMLSHDIKVPLTAMLMSLGSIQEGSYGIVPSRLVSVIERCTRSVNRVLTLLIDLIDFESGPDLASTLSKSEFDLRELAEEAIAEVASSAQTRQIKLVNECASLRVTADRKRILRVILNLLANAVKYTTEGDVVTVSTRSRESNVEMRVSDHGPGIPPQFQQIVFDKHFSIDKREHLSSGLGLAICKSFIEAHGGIIGVHSNAPDQNSKHTSESSDNSPNPSLGSSFWFTLPITADSAAGQDMVK